LGESEGGGGGDNPGGGIGQAEEREEIIGEGVTGGLFHRENISTRLIWNIIGPVSTCMHSADIIVRFQEVQVYEAVH
jgi:hypothetical protein